MKKPNHLADEKSPYLLQHAHNPVDWFPWGTAAFEKARHEQKSIFLSVGYSTCHWCHVMERESFESEAVAKILNRDFVSIKVDREERPDVDRVYMTFVQATTGSGGWPMSVFLTPELKPFFGGTYFPEKKFAQILQKIANVWRDDRTGIERESDRVTQALRGFAAEMAVSAAPLTANILKNGFDQIAHRFDSDDGGFGGAPKFPQPALLRFLLHEFVRTGERAALEMTLFTLRKMAAAGMCDQLGGGFHRYSVDVEWRVPHFEKMLYDQAQLAVAYLEAFQITRDPLLERVARATLDYVLRDLTDESGGFYCAEDADSPLANGDPHERVEGAFYVWTLEEIRDALGEEDAKIFAAFYDVQENGNVPARLDPHGELRGKNVLIERDAVSRLAEIFSKSEDEIHAILKTAREQLFTIREKRPRPHCDDKIVTAWNGLMISAFARGWQILGEPRYLAAAQRAAEFANRELFDAKTNELARSYRAGIGSVKGFADDYAFVVSGLLDLYESDFDEHWLRWADELQQKQDALFWDAAGGGYFQTTRDDAQILLRMKNDHDGAEPSANSVSALNLLRLAAMTNDESRCERAAQIFRTFSATLDQSPIALPVMLCALDFSLQKPRQIVIGGLLNSADVGAIQRVVWERFSPNQILLFANGEADEQWLAERWEFLKSLQMIGGKATAFVCENFACKAPTNDVAKLRELLR